jgi:hypothetical protein
MSDHNLLIGITRPSYYSPQWQEQNGEPVAIWLRADGTPDKDLLIPWDKSRLKDGELPKNYIPLNLAQTIFMLFCGYPPLPLEDSY